MEVKIMSKRLPDNTEATLIRWMTILFILTIGDPDIIDVFIQYIQSLS